jgi:hypothetical protein
MVEKLVYCIEAGNKAVHFLFDVIHEINQATSNIY